MNRGTKIISLLVVLLMMIGAAIAVNKTIFGCKIEASKDAAEAADTVQAVTFISASDIEINTTSIGSKISGYGGPVPLEIHLKDGKITGIEALPNSETPGFFKRASALLDKWNGLTPAEALETKVDGVTGATFSSQAIINNVNLGLEHYLGEEEKVNKDTPWKIWVALAVTLAACIFPLFIKNKIYSYAQLIANIVVLGFWCGQFLDYQVMLKYLSNGFSLPVGLVAITMLIAAFIYPIFGRPQHYCNHICPLGAAQQLVARVCNFKIKMSAATIKRLDWFRKILWAVLLLSLWTDTLTGWMDLELFQAFQVQSASWWIIGAALIFIALSAVVARPYCRFVCPTGSLFKRAENFG